MLKNTIILLVCIFTISSTVYAQKIENDSIGKIQRKNEIGLNMSPAIILFMDASLPYYNKFTLNYKRYDEKGFFRGSIGYIYIPTFFEEGRQVEIDNLKLTSSKLLKETDTTEIRLDELTRNDQWQFNFGYGWEKQKKKIQRFFGVDLIIGFQKMQAKNFINTYEKNATFYIDGDYFDELHSQQTTMLYWIGMSPFYGWKIPISNRLYFTVQLDYDLALVFGKSIDINTDNKLIPTKLISPYMLSADAIIKDLSLYFSF